MKSRHVKSLSWMLGAVVTAVLHAAEPVVEPGPAVATSPAAAPGPAQARDTPRRPAVAPANVSAQVPVQTPSATRPGQAAAARRSSADRIELETTQITGNSELPRVMYVVPWKRAELGDLSGKPAKSLLDEVLAPVDRDVFRRQNRYYDALQPDSAAAAPQVEK